MAFRIAQLRRLATRTTVLALISFCTSIAHSQDAGEHKRVLFIFNNDSFTATQQRIDRALRTTLKEGSPVVVETYSEFVGDTRAGTNYEDEFVALLKRKYEGKKFDLIFAVTNSPIQMLRRKRDEIFPGTPVVYLTLNERDIAGADIGSNATAAWGLIEFKRNIELALEFHPNTKRVVLIGGVSETDNYWRSKFQADVRSLESRVEFSNLIGLTVSEAKAALRGLPQDTIVFFVTNVRDNAGNVYESPEYLRQIASASPVPIYGTTDGQLGNGIVGGWLASFETVGAEGGRVGLRILSGESLETIQPHGISSTPMFDSRELRRWGISESSLPNGSLIQYKELSTWEEYRWYIIAASVALTIETLLIAWLLYMRYRRREAEAEAARLHGRVGDIVANVPGIVWESRTDSGSKVRRITFVSDYAEKMLGYTPAEWLADQPGFARRIMLPEDRERVRIEADQIAETGKETVTEFRWVAKDGRVRWIENHVSPILDADTDVVGLRGVALDVTNRKLAEEKARQTEEKERAILSAIPDLMFVQTLDGVYLDYHAQDLSDLFVPPEQFLGKNMRDVLPPELAGQFWDAFERASETGSTQVVEYKIDLAGHDRWFEARVVRSGENMLSVVREITQRVLDEQAIKRSEGQLAGIIASAMDAIITVDESQLILLFNAAAETIFGWSAEEVVGKKLEQLIPERYRHAHGGYVRAFGAQGATHRAMSGRGAELFGLKRSGDEFPMEASISQIELNGQKFFTVILRDITDRKRALDELRNSEQRFNKAFHSNPQPMSLSVLDSGQFLHVNDAWLAMSGYAREEVIGRTSLELGTWESAERRDALVSELRQTGSLVNVDTRFRTKDGSIRYLLSSAERMEVSGTECVLIASSDITERRQVQEALQEAHNELVIAHEEVKRLKNQLEAENIYLQEELRADQAFGDIVGESAGIKHVLYKVRQVAPLDSTVLIMGETGTGKELVARGIHEASRRKDRPLIKVNCAALSPTLIESELFGHEKGAFTGAGARKLGRFELANTGTLLLDEIGELPLELQSKLLRVLQEGEFERVGSGTTIKSDVRVIASTNRDLKAEVEKGKFREDLWYRLNVFPIEIPPLRERREDIPVLTEHFVNRFAQKLNKSITAISPDSVERLREYSWPGNIRELANVIERAVINSRTEVLRVREDFAGHEADALAASVKTLEDHERDYIVSVLEGLNWRIDGPNGAARLLGINPSTLRSRILKLGIKKSNGNIARDSSASSV